MKITKKGTIEKLDNGTIIRDFVVDCEGGPCNLSEFMELIGLPLGGKIVKIVRL